MAEATPVQVIFSGENEDRKASLPNELIEIRGIKEIFVNENGDYKKRKESTIKSPDISRAVNINEYSCPISKEGTDSKAVVMSRYVRTPNDTNDPSYTNLTLPYSVVCRQKYRDAGIRQRAQFIKEIKSHELLQNKALDGVRIHREFCNAILTPPQPEELITLTQRQKARIEEILATPLEPDD